MGMRSRRKRGRIQEKEEGCTSAASLRERREGGREGEREGGREGGRKRCE